MGLDWVERIATYSLAAFTFASLSLPRPRRQTLLKTRGHEMELLY